MSIPITPETIGLALKLMELGLAVAQKRKQGAEVTEEDVVDTLAEVRAQFAGIDVPAPYTGKTDDDVDGEPI